MSMIVPGSNIILCPRANDQSPIQIDLGAIIEAEKRTEEVQFVTPAKAGELLATFNIAWRNLHEHIVYLENERNQAERKANRIRAIIILDRVPIILREKNIASSRSPAGSEDQREAILALDDEYQDALDTVKQIECVAELLKGKLKSFEMSYNSVKKLLGEGAFNMMSQSDRRLSGDTGTEDVGTTRPIFGKASY